MVNEISINLKTSIPPVPHLEDKTKVDIRYTLISPYAYAHIYWDKEKSELMYDIEEPVLDEKDEEILDKIENAMREIVNINILVVKTTEAMIEYIDKTAKLLISELNLEVKEGSYKKIFYYLFRNFIGFNEIEALMKDYFIEDIECNGVNTPVYIVHRIYRNIKTNIVFKDIEKLANFVEKLAQRCGRYISYASPLLDGSLPDGSLDYNEPFIYKENGIVKVSKIGGFADKFYKENISDIPIKVNGIEVPCFNKELKIEWKKADYVYRHKNKEEMYKLNLEFGRSVVLTGAHSLFVLTNNGIKAEKTSNITKDGYIVIPLKIPENNIIKEFNLAKELSESSYYKKIVVENVPFILFIEKKSEIKAYLEKNYKNPYQAYYEMRQKGILPIKLWKLLPENILKKCRIKTTSAVSIPAYLEISKELLRLLGYYTAEGWTTAIEAHKKVEFCLNKKEKNLIDDIKKCFRKCFNVEMYVEKEKNNAVKLTLNSLLVWLVLNDVLKVSHYAKTKEIPELVFNVNKELRDEFIKAWYAGDYGSTASKKLAEDISYFSLLDNRIVPFYERERRSIIDNRNIKSHEHYTNFFSRNISNFPFMIPIGIINPLNETHMRLRNKKVSRERLGKILGEIRYKRFADLNSAPHKFLKEWEKRGFLNDKNLTEKGKKMIEEIGFMNKLINSDLGFVKVRNIEKIKPSSEYVYDVSVPGEENFVGGVGGVMCHNSRVNATYTTDVTSKGPTFTIRRFTKVPWTPVQLIALNTLSPEMLAYFWLLIQYKCNILITGGTASGKTSLLNALAFFIPPEARVVSIEDTRELMLPRENWLPSVARTAIGLGKVGEVDLFALLKNSFRQNPDYVIVGEVRGKEAFVLFQGMASLPGYENILVLNSNERKIIPIEKIDTEKCRAICINPFTEKSEIQPIQALIKHPSRDKLIKIKTETGREVIVTPDHSLFTYNGGDIMPIEVKNLKKDDCIIIPSKLPVGYNDVSFLDFISCLPNIRIFSPEYIKKAVAVLGYEKASELIGVKSISDYYSNFKRALPSSLKAEKFKLLMKESGIKYDIEKIKVKFLKKSKSYNAKFKITPEFLRFLGYYISEGSINMSGRNNRIALYAKDKKIVNDMIRCIKAIGCEPKRRITKGFGIATELSFSHKVMLEFLLTLCGKGSSNKKIPDFIFGLSKEKIGEFLSALYLGDGSISKNTINYYTSSKKLANDLAYLLLGFGIVGRILKRGKSRIGKHKNYTIKIYRADEKREFLKYIKIADENLLDKILKIKSKINKNKKGDIYIDKIKSIENIKFQKPIPVYDISVPGKENFIGGFGGIMLHNSGHASISTIHADSVDSVIKRLETPPIELSPTLVNTLDAVAIMSHAIVKKQQTRKLRSIVEIVEVNPDGVALTNTPFIWSPSDNKFYFKKDSKVFEKIIRRYGLTKEELVKEFVLRTKLLYEMYRRKIFGFERVQKEISEYYKNPEDVLKRYGISA